MSYGDFILLSHVNLGYCSDGGYRADIPVLYYRGVAEALNGYISAKVAEGALQPKKVEVKIACRTAQEVSHSLVEVSQNQRGYYIQIGQDMKPDLRVLVRIVNYFADSRWQSFISGYYMDKVSQETAYRILDRILDSTVGEPDMGFFAGYRQVVLQRGELQVIYVPDQLFYELAGRRLDPKPADPLPVKVRDRYLFGTEGAVIVYEGDREVQRKSHSCWPQEPIKTKTSAGKVEMISDCNNLTSCYRQSSFSGRVVFACSRLIYSYDQNRFVKVTR